MIHTSITGGNMNDINRTERKDLLRLRPLWQEICFDLVNSSTPTPDGSVNVTIGDICEAYNVTQDELSRLLKTPEFRRVLKDTRRRVDAMGDNAAIMLRAQALAVPLMERVASGALQPSAELKEQINALKLVANLGNLDPATNGTNKQRADTGGGGASAVAVVQFVLPAGIPGIDHVAPHGGGSVIEGEAVNVSK